MRRNPPSTLYRYLDLPSTQIIQTHNRHNTTTPSLNLVQVFHPLAPNATHTTATKTQTHIPLPHVPPELVKPKPNPVTHSSPTPPTPPRAKHIHMSHTPHTPLTTLISSTSPALDKTLEPRVPPIYALTATTPPPDPTPALRSPSHPNSLAGYTHAKNPAIHAPQSPQQPYLKYRVLRQPHRQTKD